MKGVKYLHTCFIQLESVFLTQSLPSFPVSLNPYLELCVFAYSSITHLEVSDFYFLKQKQWARLFRQPLYLHKGQVGGEIAKYWGETSLVVVFIIHCQC